MVWTIHSGGFTIVLDGHHRAYFQIYYIIILRSISESEAEVIVVVTCQVKWTVELKIMVTMSGNLCCLLFVLIFVNDVKCNDNLRVAYEWKQIEFQYRNAIDRDNSLHNPNNAIPVGLEVYKSRLFITLPRWREGVPASLAYLDLNGWLYFFRLFVFTYII